MSEIEDVLDEFFFSLALLTLEGLQETSLGDYFRMEIKRLSKIVLQERKCYST